MNWQRFPILACRVSVPVPTRFAIAGHDSEEQFGTLPVPPWGVLAKTLAGAMASETASRHSTGTVALRRLAWPIGNPASGMASDSISRMGCQLMGDTGLEPRRGVQVG